MQTSFQPRRQQPEQLQPPVLLSKTPPGALGFTFYCAAAVALTKQVSINRQLFMTSWLKKN